MCVCACVRACVCVCVGACVNVLAIRHGDNAVAVAVNGCVTE